MVSSVILVPGFFAFYYLIKRIREYGITENILAYIGSMVFVALFYLKDNGKLKILGFYEYIFVVLVCSFLLALTVYIMRTRSLYKDIIYLPIVAILIVIWKYLLEESTLYYLLLVFVLIDYLLRTLLLKQYKVIALVGSFIVYFILSVSNPTLLEPSNMANKEQESLGSELRDGSEILGNNLTLFVDDEKISFPREFKFTMKYNNFETSTFRSSTYKVKTPDEEEHNEVEISGTGAQEKVDIRKGYNKDNESLVNAIKFLVGRDIANKLHDELNANYNNFYSLSRFRYLVFYEMSSDEKNKSFFESENIKLKENQDGIVFLLTTTKTKKDFLVDFSEEEQIKTIKNLMKTKVLKDVNKKEYLIAFTDSYNKEEQARNINFIYNVSIKDNGEVIVEKSMQ
jgi:membrane protein